MDIGGFSGSGNICWIFTFSPGYRLQPPGGRGGGGEEDSVKSLAANIDPANHGKCENVSGEKFSRHVTHGPQNNNSINLLFE
jgi:hypothetical protein